MKSILRSQRILLLLLFLIITAQAINFISNRKSAASSRQRAWNAMGMNCKHQMMLIYEHGMELKKEHPEDFLKLLHEEIQHPTDLKEAICICPMNMKVYQLEPMGDNDFLVMSSNISREDRTGRFVLSHGKIFGWQDRRWYQD